MSRFEKKFINPWFKRLLLRKISGVIIVVSLSVSLLVTGVTIYGKNVGNFVISVDKETRYALSLSEDGDFEKHSTTILQAEGLTDAIDATYSYIPADIGSKAGADNDYAHRYTAYTFFLKNSSPLSSSYNMKIVIDDEYRGISAAMRIMVITNGERVIYAKRDKDGNVVEHNDLGEFSYKTQPFNSASEVCDLLYANIDPEEVVKYTVVMWLEGWDEDCVDSIKGGAIRLTMNFTIR